MQFSQSAGVLSPGVGLPKQRLLPEGYGVEAVLERLDSLGVETICKSGNCPNRGICFALRHVSVLILGDVCTRNCMFCSVRKANEGLSFENETEAVISLAKEMNLSSIVITSVTRDDLLDYGAGHFEEVVFGLKKVMPELKIELLIPDFMGRFDLLDRILALPVDIVGHNIETVRDLYPVIRPASDFDRSLKVIEYMAGSAPEDMEVKSSFMLGLGEDDLQIEGLIRELAGAGLKSLCIGQYLSPTKHNFKVRRVYDKIYFKRLREFALKCGIDKVLSGPFVRSSFSLKEGRDGVE